MDNSKQIFEIGNLKLELQALPEGCFTMDLHDVKQKKLYTLLVTNDLIYNLSKKVLSNPADVYESLIEDLKTGKRDAFVYEDGLLTYECHYNMRKISRSCVFRFELEPVEEFSIRLTEKRIQKALDKISKTIQKLTRFGQQEKKRLEKNFQELAKKLKKEITTEIENIISHAMNERKKTDEDLNLKIAESRLKS